MESNLRDARQQYEAALTELRTKAGVLGAACDREAATRQQLESEVAGLTGKLEQSHSKIDELMKQNMELEKCVCTVSLASAECVCTVYAVTAVCIDLRALIRRCGHASRADWVSEKSKIEKELELSRDREQVSTPSCLLSSLPPPCYCPLSLSL